MSSYQSTGALEELVGHAETILQKLGLPYRTVVLCGGIGFSAAKTYDIGLAAIQNKYRESILTLCRLQARRMKARYRNTDGKPDCAPSWFGLAVGRTSGRNGNYQQEDGSIAIPGTATLNGLTHIKCGFHPFFISKAAMYGGRWWRIPRTPGAEASAIITIVAKDFVRIWPWMLPTRHGCNGCPTLPPMATCWMCRMRCW